MKKTHNTVTIQDTQPGQIIAAKKLTNMARAINANTRYLTGPRQQGALDESEGSSAGVLNLEFTETSRAATSKTITDTNGDTHVIEQIDQVTLVNVNGEVMTLNFNNP